MNSYNYGISWSSQILDNIFKKMSSFSNSFDSEIVLLGKERQVRPGKHSRVANVPIHDNESFNDEDLHIEDSVSVRTLSTLPVTSDDEKSRATTGTFLIKPPQDFIRKKIKDFPHSAAFSSTSSVKRKRKISKVKTKAKTQKDELAEAVIKGDLQKIEDIIDVLDMVHGRGIFVVLPYKYCYNPDTDTVRSQESSESATDFSNEFNDSLNAIHLACIFDQEQVIEFLSMYGINKIKQSLASENSKDPSHVAAWYGAVACLHSLNKSGLDISVEDESKKTALHFAAMRNHRNVLEYLLNHNDELIDKTDSAGKSSLHHAALNSNLDCVKVLINHGANVNARDVHGYSVLHMSSHPTIIEELLDHGADPGLKSADGNSVFSHFLDTVPDQCKSIMNSYMTKNNFSTASKSLEVRFDFQMWETEMNYLESDGFQKILNSNQIELLKHPLAESFLHMKHDLVGKLYNIADLVLYSIFLVSITAVILANHSPWFITLLGDYLDTTHYTALALTIGCLVLYILLQILKLLFLFESYLKTLNENLLWLLVLSLTTVYISLISSNSTINVNAVQQLASIVITLVWVYVMVVLADFPSVGIYLIMLRSVAKLLIIFFALFSFIIIAFALSFHLLVPGPSHKDPFSSFLSTLAMMFGELDFAGKFSSDVIVYHGATEFLIMCFIIFIGIIIVNFLIGLSIDNMTGIFQRAGVMRLKLTVEQVAMIETLLARVGTCCRKSLLTSLQRLGDNSYFIYVYPNQSNKVFVKTAYKQLKDTKFRLPSWVINNIIKNLEERNKEAGQNHAINNEVEKSVKGVKKEVALMKKDIKTIKKDLQVLLEYVKFAKK